MSIAIKGKEDGEGFVYHKDFEDGIEQCFLCNEFLGKTAIHWMGCGGDIYFHPACAISFARRILQDCKRYFDPEKPLHNEP